MSRVLTHANIYLLPAIAPSIIPQDVKKSLPRNSNTHFSIVLVWQTIGMMVLETCSWMPDGGMWEGARMLVWVRNILYVMLYAGFAFSWFVYIYSRIPGVENLLENRKKLWLLSIPVLISCLILIMTPWTYWVFWVNGSNSYEHGPYYIAFYLFISGYMLTTIVLSFLQRRRTTRVGEKQECMWLAVYAIIPIAGLVLQLLDYKFWSAWPFTVLVILTIYVSMQDGQITTDGLTGLNNRRQLEKYPLSRCDMNDGKLWCLIIPDVDDFRSINDVYGHIVRDKVLYRVAKVLETACSNTDSFLARSGGDEFVVVASRDEVEKARDVLQPFYDKLEESNRQAAKPLRVTLSAGYVCYDGVRVNDRHSLMKVADEAMYWEKQRRKAGDYMPAQ